MITYVSSCHQFDESRQHKLLIENRLRLVIYFKAVCELMFETLLDFPSIIDFTFLSTITAEGSTLKRSLVFSLFSTQRERWLLAQDSETDNSIACGFKHSLALFSLCNFSSFFFVKIVFYIFLSQSFDFIAPSLSCRY